MANFSENKLQDFRWELAAVKQRYLRKYGKQGQIIWHEKPTNKKVNK
jgi:hypothetical protein